MAESRRTDSHSPYFQNLILFFNAADRTFGGTVRKIDVHIFRVESQAVGVVFVIEGGGPIGAGVKSGNEFGSGEE